MREGTDGAPAAPTLEAQVRSAMLAALAHDLRAPWARLWQQAAMLAGEAGQPLAASAEQQLALLEDLQDFVRWELQAPETVAAPVYLHGLLQDVAALGARLAQQQAAAFHCELGALPPVAVIDRDAVPRLLGKLLRHAAAVSPGGSVRLALAWQREAGGAWLHCSVAGSGVSGGCMEHPLRGRTQAPAAAALALGSAVQLAQALRSPLRALAAPWPGHAIALACPPAAESEVLLPVPPDLALAADGRRIVVLEPLAAMRDYLSELLLGAGCEVLVAHGVEDALQLAGQLGRHEALLCADEVSGIDPSRLRQSLRARHGAAAPALLLHAAQAPLEEYDGLLYKPAGAAALLAALAGLARRA
ncbi:hypothetical protein MJ904_07080 [Massilia sp. MB5]|uniref:sensor histidine kinase n=1 Tax=Massilia sp. MB5 TaxID=2919578 RepID=UPI001F117AA2|nr:hypothetical protein [Massilia sp. MB5]UMR31938.1 hypothetical protein MJ904_07080 [Massilia sp. MB5]